MKTIDTYTSKLRATLSPAERRVFKKLTTPKKIQDFLDSFPIHFVGKGKGGIYSPRAALQYKKMHCMEGAVVAAAALAYHGRPPLLLDFQTTPQDEDHVIALFQQGKYWGALSKTNHPVLRWRDPVYASVRELAMSYFHEYYMWNKSDGKLYGKKTLRAFSKPFDLRRYAPPQWFGAEDLDWLAVELDDSPHYPTFGKGMQKYLRNASKIELTAMKLEEWKKPKN
ncbi:MAG: hypothetical protein AAB449_01845 [Patescibacteria group bacterium]